MKTKKIVSIVLAVVMVAGLWPMSALAQSSLLDKVFGGRFVDTSADPLKSYEYIVNGTDGTNQKITVLGSDADTGNTMTQVATAGTVYYVRVHNYDTTGNEYLLVGEAGGKNFAMNKNGKGTTQVNVVNDPGLGEIIRGDYADIQWSVAQSKGGNDSAYRYITNNDGDWLYVANGGVGLSLDSSYELELKAWDNNTFKLFRCEDQGWWANQGKFCLFYIDENGTVTNRNYTRGYGDTWPNKVSGGTSFKWYQRREVLNDEYTIDTTALENLIALAAEREQYADTYSPATWGNFAAAIEAARQAVADDKSQGVYQGQAAANEAFANIVNKHIELQNALDALILDIGVGECVTPEITWERTTETTDVVTGVTTISDNDYSKIIWEWDKAYDNGRKVKDLPTNTTTNVWNHQEQSVSAATWSKVGGGDWKVSSVRRFSGTFIWPHGYDFNDKAVIESKNDANYQYIYDYINDNPELKARYGDSKVFAINDNMYAFITSDAEQPSQWTTQQALDHMVFWTGTDGKGIWTDIGSGGDAGRKTPATFQGIAATPAFRGGHPNNGDIPGNDTDSPWLPNSVLDKIEFSDDWYSLVDTTAMMSTLRDLYGVNEDFGGKKMRIEIFAFDNSQNGGMDEPIIRICKPTADDVTVKINYWLDQVNGTSLGTTTKFTTDNAVINLPAGTNANELNYKRGAAVIAAGTGADVSLGVQQKENFIAHKGQENVINVVYTSNVKNRTYFTYDFALNNRFEYKDANPLAIRNARVEGIEGAAVSSVAGHKVYIDYKPTDSFGHVLNGELVIERTNNEVNRYPIAIIPASNVYYEENFLKVKAGDGANWVQIGETNNKDIVTDNETSVFGYTNLYAGRNGYDTYYHADVRANGPERFTDEINFSFRGTGFDVIGSSSSSTGTLVVKVKNRDTGKTVKNYMVNTKHNTALDSIPVLHCEGLDSGVYDVTIKGAYVFFESNSTRSSYSLLSTKNSMNDNSPYAVLAEMGFTDEEIKNTEYINMQDHVSSRAFSLRNSKNVPATNGPQPITMQVYVDAIRVYRSTQGAENVYPANEANVTYNNILNAQEASFTAYMESQFDGKYGVEDYRKFGGPANELYLKPGGAVAIAVDPSVQKTQISARAVEDNSTQMKVNEGSEPILIPHRTEMYYEVTPVNGVIVIANVGSSMLAIGNVKTDIKSINDEQKTKAVMMMNRMMNEPVPEIFEPEKLNVKISVIKGLFNNYATIRTTASADVDFIELNGVKVKARNAGLVNIGLAKNKQFVKRFKLAKGEPIVVNVTAYDKNGNASETVVKSK